MGASEDESRFIGFVDKRNSSTRYEEPPAALFAFGMMGALLHSNIREQGVPVFHYVIKTPDGDVNAEATEAYAIGDCVDVSGKLAAGKSRTFPYGDVRITRSSQCR